MEGGGGFASFVEVPIGSTDDVEKAVAAARTAFPSWSQSSIEERQG